MLIRTLTKVIMAVSGLMAVIGATFAADEAKYPDWKGSWARWAPPNATRDGGNGGTLATAGGQPSFDQTKPWGPGQQAPLTPKYQQVLKDSMADQVLGGQGNFFDHAVRCMPGGMPISMIAFRPLEFVVTPETTYVLIGDATDHYRRIFTDGRDWPENLEPTYQGYSIGRWSDEDGDGIFDTLHVETRGPFKGPRVYDASGLPLDFDNQSIFFERLYRDRSNPKILHDEITVIDHALTRPWTVDKKYVLDAKADWGEGYCSENPTMIAIGNQSYYLGGDGKLMPTRKNQAPPDLKYFKARTK